MLSVIIPHLNQPAELARGLAALAAQQGVRDDFEIIVVDNGSRVLPEAICAPYANVRLLEEPQPGPGPARNKGIAEARGKILACIDADCVAAPDWLAAIERRLSPEGEQTIFGGNVFILCNDPARPTLLEAYESVFAYRMREYIERQGFTGGGNLAFRVEVFGLVGPFKGIDIAEDTEWGQRASRKGFKVRHAPDMVVLHPARSCFAELARKWDRHIAHDFTQIRSEPMWWPRWVIRSAAVAASPVAEVVRIYSSDRLSGLRARLLAFAGVVRIRLYRARTMLALAGSADASQLSGSWNRT